MSMNDVVLPEVVSAAARGRFFKDDNGSDRIEISFVGSKDTVIHEVTPEIMAQWRNEWLAYQDGQPLKPRGGTPLNAIPGMTEQRINHYLNQQITNVEELAALSDMQCQTVGHGTLTDRKTARQLLAQASYEKEQARIAKMEKAMAAAQPVRNEQADAKLDQLIAGQSALTAAITGLVQTLQQQPQKRGPGRPPKAKEADDA